RRTNTRRVFYVGQDRLRSAYGGNRSTYSRSVLAIHIILRSLRECPSDRDIRKEVEYNLTKRSQYLREAHEELSSVMKSGLVPVALVRSLTSIMADMNGLIFDEAHMKKTQELMKLMDDATNSPYRVREAFRKAGEDIADSQEILAGLADSIVDESFRQAVAVRPNDRLVRVLDELGKKPRIP
ncbi:MAG TPA: hypothetical protein VKI44_05320, partial [Acetobacteraceae bacterium]|nr:hypothetical protein [Acetobacteraceae bacterium]